NRAPSQSRHSRNPAWAAQERHVLGLLDVIGRCERSAAKILCMIQMTARGGAVKSGVVQHGHGRLADAAPVEHTDPDDGVDSRVVAVGGAEPIPVGRADGSRVAARAMAWRAIAF